MIMFFFDRKWAIKVQWQEHTVTSCSDNSTQQENQVLSISLIKKIKYWNLFIHLDQLYALLNMCHVEQKFEETR